MEVDGSAEVDSATKPIKLDGNEGAEPKDASTPISFEDFKKAREAKEKEARDAREAAEKKRKQQEEEARHRARAKADVCCRALAPC